jgi:hypothetical protein
VIDVIKTVIAPALKGVTVLFSHLLIKKNNDFQSPLGAGARLKIISKIIRSKS